MELFTIDHLFMILTFGFTLGYMIYLMVKTDKQDEEIKNLKAFIKFKESGKEVKKLF